MLKIKKPQPVGDTQLMLDRMWLSVVFGRAFDFAKTGAKKEFYAYLV